MAFKLVLSADGKIESLIDTRTNNAVTYTVHVANTPPSDALDKSVIATCCTEDKIPAHIRKELNAVALHGLTLIPFHSYGYAILLGATIVPKGSFFPFLANYATCLSCIELHTRRPGGVLDDSYFTGFNNLDAVRAILRAPPDPTTIPGVILAEGAKHLLEFTSPAISDDPLIKTFQPTYLNTYSPAIGDDDYLFVAKSNWEGIPKAVIESEAATEQTHYYLVLKWSLPIEVSDQIAMIIYSNWANDTWRKLSTRQFLDRAHEMSVACAEHIMERALTQLRMKKHATRSWFVHTLSNVFDANPIKAHIDDATAVEGVAFYKDCAPTHKSTHGILCEKDAKQSGWLYICGPDDGTGVFGGTAFKMPKTMSAWPTLMHKDAVGWTKDGLKQFTGEGGWDSKNGFTKLQPVVEI
jgi:hypothetical protein